MKVIFGKSLAFRGGGGGGPAPTEPSFEGDATTGGSGSLSHTFTSASTADTALPATFTAGKKLIYVYHEQTDGVGLASVVVDGVTATQRGAGSGDVTFWEAVITGGNSNDIVVTANSGGFSSRVAVAMHDVTGFDFQSAVQVTATPSIPETLTANFTTSAGDAVIYGLGATTLGRTYTPTNVTVRTDDMDAGGHAVSVYSNTNTTGGSPEGFSVEISNSGNTTVEAVHYAPA